MARTFKSLLEERTNLHRSLAIHEQIVKDLERFIPLYDTADATIDAGEFGKVPHEMVQKVVDHLKTDFIDVLKQRIDELENQEIPGERKEQEATKTNGRPEGAGKEGGQGPRQAGADPVRAGSGQPAARKVSIRNRQ